jgi:hypothetical protein
MKKCTARFRFGKISLTLPKEAIERPMKETRKRKSGASTFASYPSALFQLNYLSHIQI